MANLGVCFLSVVALASCCLSVMNHFRYEFIRNANAVQNEDLNRNTYDSHARSRRDVKILVQSNSSSQGIRWEGKSLFEDMGELMEFIRVNRSIEDRLMELRKEVKCKCPGVQGQRGPPGAKGDNGIQGPPGPRGLGLYPPRVTHKLLDVTSEAGKDKVFTCRFFGNPLPTTHWKTAASNVKIETEIDREKSEITTALQISNITWADRGNVSCFASNLFGNINESGYLTVLAPPIMSLPSEPLISVIGMTANFPECKVTSIPAVSIAWKRGFLTFPKQRTYKKGGILRISRLKVQDEGYYKCIAKNYLGTTTKIIHLRAKPLHFSKKPRFYMYTSHPSMPLSCGAYGPVGKLSGKWYDLLHGKELQNVTTSQNGREFVITIFPSRNGKYKCVITNNITEIESYTEVAVLKLTSSIMNAKQINKLGTWMRNGKGIGEYKLCWSQERDGFNLTKFYRACGEKPNSISIFKNNRSVIFGGFTDAPWRTPKVGKLIPTYSDCGGRIRHTGVKIKYSRYSSMPCTWNVVLNIPIMLNFNISASCDHNGYLVIKDDSVEVKRYCGQHKLVNYFSRSGRVNLRFRGGNYRQKRLSVLITDARVQYGYSSRSFLFTFLPTALQIPVHNQNRAICHMDNYGPCFGEKELYVHNETVVASIGRSYQSDVVTPLSFGEHNVTDIEVHYKT